VEGLIGTCKEAAVFVAGNSGHVANSERRVAFVDDMEARTGLLETLPVLKGSTSEQFLEFITRNPFDAFGGGIRDGVDGSDRSVGEVRLE
jgi:hypothetical protein